MSTAQVLNRRNCSSDYPYKFGCKLFGFVLFQFPNDCSSSAYIFYSRSTYGLFTRLFYFRKSDTEVVLSKTFSETVMLK